MIYYETLSLVFDNVLLYITIVLRVEYSGKFQANDKIYHQPITNNCRELRIFISIRFDAFKDMT